MFNNLFILSTRSSTVYCYRLRRIEFAKSDSILCIEPVLPYVALDRRYLVVPCCVHRRSQTIDDRMATGMKMLSKMRWWHGGSWSQSLELCVVKGGKRTREAEGKGSLTFRHQQSHTMENKKRRHSSVAPSLVAPSLVASPPYQLTPAYGLLISNLRPMTAFKRKSRSPYPCQAGSRLHSVSIQLASRSEPRNVAVYPLSSDTTPLLPSRKL